MSLQSSGREPWIFRVDRPDELIGVHRELIASALVTGEKILHLIYSPAFEGTKAPFGISGHAASYGIALTPARWIISEDRHQSWVTPHVRSIPFSDILVLEKGSALLQAWMVIRFRDSGALQHFTLLHKAIGSHHFDDAIRTYRRLTAASAETAPDDTSSGEWQHIPRYLAQELMPVLIDGEHVSASTRTCEEWHEERRRWRRIAYCSMPWSALLLTDRGILYAEAEAGERPGFLSFGSNVWCVPPNTVRVSQPIDKNGDHCRTPYVRLSLTRGTVRMDVDAAIPSADHGILQELPNHV